LIGRPAQGRSDVSLDRSGNVRGNTIAASNAASLRNAAPGTRPLAPERIARLREFSAKAKTQNVKILVIPPALIMTPAYGAARFRHFQDSLNSLYTGLGMLPVGDPVIGFLPPEDMYDSVYHANDRGRARYTQRVLDAICRAAFCQRATR
jgi:hypothetical protein